MVLKHTPEIADVLTGPGAVNGHSGAIHCREEVSAITEAALSAPLDGNLLHSPAGKLSSGQQDGPVHILQTGRAEQPVLALLNGTRFKNLDSCPDHQIPYICQLCCTDHPVRYLCELGKCRRIEAGSFAKVPCSCFMASCWTQEMRAGRMLGCQIRVGE